MWLRGKMMRQMHLSISLVNKKIINYVAHADDDEADIELHIFG